MSQVYLLAQTTNELHLVNYPTLKKCSAYSLQKLHGIELADVPQQPVFVQLYDDKKSFEILRVKAVDGNGTVEKLKKVTFNQQMTTITGVNKKSNEIAVGYASGHVRLINIQTNERLKSFNPEISNNEVSWINFNCKDEYAVVVYENGNVRTFSVQKGVQSEKITVHKSIGVIRYHGTKPHVMGQGFGNGAIQIWDSLKKCAIYKDGGCHKAPVRDVAWDTCEQDLFYTAGYDCRVKLIDIRKQFCGMTLMNEHPIHSICVSLCGKYITTGNSSGVLHLYDTRNPRQFLYESDLSGGVSNNRIQRVTRVPGDYDASFVVETPEKVEVSETQGANTTPNNSLDDLIAQSRNVGRRVSIEMSNNSVLDSHGRRSSLMGAGPGRLSADFGAQNLMRYLDSSTDSFSNDSPVVPSPQTTRNHHKSVPIPEEAFATTPKTSNRSQKLLSVSEADGEESGSYSTPQSLIESASKIDQSKKEADDFIPNGQATSTPNIPVQAVSKHISIRNDSEVFTPPTITASTITQQDMSQLFAAISEIRNSINEVKETQQETLNKVVSIENRLEDMRINDRKIEFILTIGQSLNDQRIMAIDDAVKTLLEYVSLACPIDEPQPQLQFHPENYH